MPPVKSDPKLTNRGAAGLYGKLSDEQKARAAEEAKKEKVKPAPEGVDRVDTGEILVLPIGSLTTDPLNARVHNERNMEAIRLSLQYFGQTKAIVVRKKTMTVVAGNGTLEAAKQLGWTRIKANVIDMTDKEAAAYGVADNRSAELAKWNLENLSVLEKLIHRSKMPVIGFTPEELLVLRGMDFRGPERNGRNEPSEPVEPSEQDQVIAKALELVRQRKKCADWEERDCLALICKEWTKHQKELAKK